jgi:hypothetical protein
MRGAACLIRRPVLKGAAFMFVYAVCQCCQPLLLRELVNEISAQRFEGLYYALGLTAVTTVASFANQRHLHHAFRCVHWSRDVRVPVGIVVDMSLSECSRAIVSVFPPFPVNKFRLTNAFWDIYLHKALRA